MLSGYKTYLAAVVMIVLAGLKALEYIDASTYETLIGLFGALGLATLRSSIK